MPATCCCCHASLHLSALPQPVQVVGAADDIGGPSEYLSEEGLHLHAWTGLVSGWNVAGSMSSHGTISGCFTGPHAAMAKLHRKEDFRQALDEHLPQMPETFRRQVAESAVVCPGPSVLRQSSPAQCTSSATAALLLHW